MNLMNVAIASSSILISGGVGSWQEKRVQKVKKRRGMDLFFIFDNDLMIGLLLTIFGMPRPVTLAMIHEWVVSPELT
jgi:hypothetical protein